MGVVATVNQIDGDVSEVRDGTTTKCLRDVAWLAHGIVAADLFLVMQGGADGTNDEQSVRYNYGDADGPNVGMVENNILGDEEGEVVGLGSTMGANVGNIELQCTKQLSDPPED